MILLSPPSGPAQWLFQEPAAERKFLAAIHEPVLSGSDMAKGMRVMVLGIALSTGPLDAGALTGRSSRHVPMARPTHEEYVESQMPGYERFRHVTYKDNMKGCSVTAIDMDNDSIVDVVYVSDKGKYFKTDKNDKNPVRGKCYLQAQRTYKSCLRRGLISQRKSPGIVF